MKLLLRRDPPQEDDLVWLDRATVDTVSLAPGAWVALTNHETLLESVDGRWVWVGSRDLVPSFRQPQDPAELARGAPSAVLDRLSGNVMLLAHPLGRGTFFHAAKNSATYMSTCILDVCERQARLRPNAATVANYFASLRNRGVCLTDTFVEGVSQLAPGSQADWDGGVLRHRSYWTPLDDTENGTLDIRQAATRVRGALEDVLRQDFGQSTACLVSGGLDSSAVAGVRLKLNGPRVSFVTYGHDLDSSREKRLRDNLAGHLGISIDVLPLSNTRFDLEAVRCANRGANSPSGGLSSGIFSEILSAAREAGYDTVLTGDGGDEVFDPSPFLLADLIRSRRWRPMLSALSFFASYQNELSVLQLLFEHGVAPLAVAAHLPYPLPARDAVLDEVLGSDFAPMLAAARSDARKDMAQALTDGWNLVTYQSYRQVLDLVSYEAVDLRAIDQRVRVISPLSSLEVLRAANTLRLDQRAGPWLGFRSKRLLAIAASDILPYDVAYSPKTGVGNLLWRLAGRFESVSIEDLDLTILASIGINVAPHWLQASNYPIQGSIIWPLVMKLCTWYRELENSIAERRRFPCERRTIRNLRQQP